MPEALTSLFSLLADSAGTPGDSLADDILRGATAIGAHIKETEKRVYYLVQNELIPVGKQGATLIGSKRVLNAFYAALASGTFKMETGPPSQPPAQTADRRRLTKPPHPRRNRLRRRNTGPTAAEATPTSG